MERKSWDQYFMDIAKMASTRATCSRAQVGAVFVRDNRILTVGYNGAPSGVEHCNHLVVPDSKYNSYDLDTIDGHCWRSVHAETNAILQAAILGISLSDSTLYCTHFPCLNCAKSIRQLNVRHVYYLHGYDITMESRSMLRNFTHLEEK